MIHLYQQALSLYNQGDNEGVWDLLQNADLGTMFGTWKKGDKQLDFFCR